MVTPISKQKRPGPRTFIPEAEEEMRAMAACGTLTGNFKADSHHMAERVAARFPGRRCVLPRQSVISSTNSIALFIKSNVPEIIWAIFKSGTDRALYFGHVEAARQRTDHFMIAARAVAKDTQTWLIATPHPVDPRGRARPRIGGSRRAQDRLAGRHASHLLPLPGSCGREPVLALGRGQGAGVLHLHRAGRALDLRRRHAGRGPRLRGRQAARRRDPEPRTT